MTSKLLGPTAAVALSALLPCRTPAQQLSDRVAALGDGTASFTYAARSDVCGDGRSIILGEPDGSGEITYFFPNGDIMTGLSRERLPGCRHSPVRVRLTVRSHRIIALIPSVGWTDASPGGTDLGTVGTQQAAAVLLDVARTAPEEVSRNAILGAALADSVRISSRLLALARDRSLNPPNREQALKWLSRTAPREGNDTADAGVRAIAADGTDDPDVRERAIRTLVHPADDAFLRELYPRLALVRLKERVIRALAESPTPLNTDWIERVALDARENLELRDRAVRVLGEELHEWDRLQGMYGRLSHPDLKDRVVRVVGEASDEAGLRWIRTLIENRAEPLEPRDRAIRMLGEQGEGEYLRQVYAHLDHPDLKQRVLKTLGEAGGRENAQFLRAVALDGGENGDLRERALRMYSEAGTPTPELVSLYDAIAVQDLRARLINLLAERGDAAARAKLTRIVREDPDPELRTRAMRRLGERGGRG